jgi:hypothetical protein
MKELIVYIFLHPQRGFGFDEYLKILYKFTKNQGEVLLSGGIDYVRTHGCAKVGAIKTMDC